MRDLMKPIGQAGLEQTADVEVELLMLGLT